ncbi:PREDICTED: DNA (cytosine-5)-methyltransferase 3-like [Crocodylus porosus]|uniref:DNA (cytosine-5)-methyltransferase 3-like n=1 Tax=Crocodylus porosus TaxID=8502 RepID=UPI00093D81D5|nr:PREDICTED: DNA (cytosine-5)-methyltransferase 3-like [Crocodylus porosus]
MAQAVVLSDTDSTEDLEEGQASLSDMAVSLEKDSTSDVISLGSVEEITSPNRDHIVHEVIKNQRSIEEICICCGSFKVHTQHPLFHGGICSLCTENFLETFFLYDDDGLQSYCTICCSGKILLMCDEPTCNRGYCFKCLDVLVSPGTAEKVKAMNTWLCFMCLPLSSHGLLQKKQRWRTKLKCFYDQESENHFKIYRPVPAWDRKPISILSLFDNITPEMKSIGFLDSSLGNGRLKYLHDVTNILRMNVKEWGPFDFIFGSTPPVGNSYDHPPAWYFYQYYQILQYGKPLENSERPFFWMFVDNLVLTEEDRDTASRFFKTEAVTVHREHGETIQNAVIIWSNIPSVKSKYSLSDLNVDLHLLAKNIIRKRILSQQPATLVKKFFLPLKEYFKCFS